MTPRGTKEYGDYGVMVTLELVELSSRVRFPIVAQPSKNPRKGIFAILRSMKKFSVAIVGYGQLGRFMARHLEKYCHIVPIEKNTSPSKIEECNAVIFAVPWANFKVAVDTLRPYIRKDALILDVTSVKQKPMALLKKYFKGHEILGTHPIFGPQSGKDGIEGLPIVLCNISFSKTHYIQIKKFLSRELKLTVLEQTPAQHDTDMALVQGLTHFIGRAVVKMGVVQHSTDTRSYKHLLELRQLLAHDSWELFETIQSANPQAQKVRKKFLLELQRIEKKLR